MTENPFNWRGKPSVFVDKKNLQQFNENNHSRSVRMTNADKKDIVFAKGEFLPRPTAQVNAYGKAK
jgi:hypothetical protein